MSVTVLIADKFPEEKLEEMRALGCEIVYDQSLKEGSLLAALRRYKPDVLIVRSTVVEGEMIRSDRRLNLIIRAGSGVNTIDVESASSRSIYVANCPGKNAIAVAELTFGLILALDRRIPDNVAALREGKWNKKEFSKANGIYGRTLGVIGVGRIGREVISRARAFGMHVIAWSRSLDQHRARLLGIDYRKNPDAVARDADIITVHLALAPETRGAIGSQF
jgi:D-3-phosphoglycerate dehydrogenase